MTPCDNISFSVVLNELRMADAAPEKKADAPAEAPAEKEKSPKKKDGSPKKKQGIFDRLTDTSKYTVRCKLAILFMLHHCAMHHPRLFTIHSLLHTLYVLLTSFLTSHDPH